MIDSLVVHNIKTKVQKKRNNQHHSKNSHSSADSNASINRHHEGKHDGIAKHKLPKSLNVAFGSSYHPDQPDHSHHQNHHTPEGHTITQYQPHTLHHDQSHRINIQQVHIGPLDSKPNSKPHSGDKNVHLSTHQSPLHTMNSRGELTSHSTTP